MTPVSRLAKSGRIATLSMVVVAAFAVGTVHADEADVSIWSQSESMNHFGALLDFGVPDALGVSFVARPWQWLRLHVGPSTNAISVGIRGGATVVPLNYWISPSFTLEGGHLFQGDANTLTKLFGFESEALEDIGYTYMNIHGGVEIGSPNRFVFYIHGGMSYAVTTVSNLQNLVRNELNDNSINFEDPGVTYIGPSAKIGFILYI